MPPPASEPRPVSAYIPCYNNARTVGIAIEGIRNQSRAVDELFVVDDGSTDDSAAVAEALGVGVIRMGRNCGRGAVRARAMEAARHELVLCCDATNRLATNFLEVALEWLSREKVVAAFGRMCDRDPCTTVSRWRARHLFQQDMMQHIVLQACLSTYGALMRRSTVLKVGNYNRLLRHGEDYELGVRLQAVGETVFDPALEVETAIENTLLQVMERFARWNRSAITSYNLNDLIENHIVAWRILIPKDLRHRDWRAALISATAPYFCVAHADKLSLKFSLKQVLDRFDRSKNESSSPASGGNRTISR